MTNRRDVTGEMPGAAPDGTTMRTFGVRPVSMAVLVVAMLAALALWSGVRGPTAAAIPGEGSNGAWGELMDWPINPIHASLTPEGKLLTYGGTASGGQGGFLLDVWDPETGLNSTVPHNSGTNLFCSFALNTADGAGILIFGGQNYNGNDPDFNSDFRNGSLNPMPDMNSPRWYPSATTLADGRLLVQGGTSSGTGGVPATTPEVLENGSWKALPGAQDVSLYGTNEGNFRGWWYPRSWVTPAGRIFNIAQDQMYYLDPDGNGEIERLGTFPEGAVAATSTSVMFDTGKVLQVGGGWRESDNDTIVASQQAVIIDLNFDPPRITRAADMNYPRHWATAIVLADGKVLVNGGSEKNNRNVGVAYQPELWDPATNTWTILDANNTMRLYHATTVLLPDGSVFTGGGGSPGPVTNTNAEIFYPPNLYTANGGEAPRPTLTNAPAGVTYGESFSVTASGSIDRVTLVKTQNSTHAMNTQIFQELEFTQSGNQLTIAAPDLATVATPGMYMLHVLNSDGVPSEAAMVTVNGSGGSAPAASAPPADRLANASFEAPKVNDGAFRAGAVPGWQSTDENRVEIWGNLHNAIAGTDGNQIGQVNVDGPMSIFQDLDVTPGATYEWSVDHRGNTNVDRMEVRIAGQLQVTAETGTAWQTYAGSWTAPAGATTARFELKGLDSDGISNMIDNVQFALVNAPTPPTATPVPPTATPVPPTATPVPPTATPVPPTGPTELSDGVALSGLTGAAGTAQYFTIEVPVGATELTVDLSGAGDADLYVNPLVAPTQTVWQCRPYTDGSSNETCTIANPNAGTWHIMVRGWAAFTNNSLVASVSNDPTPPPPPSSSSLSNGVPSELIAGAAGSTQAWTVDVPAGASQLTVAMAGSGDADLYLNHASAASLANWDCRPYTDGSSNETCTITNPAAGTWHVLVNGWAAYSATSVTATWSDTPAPPSGLQNGQPTQQFAGDTGSETTFTFSVPAGTSTLTVDLTGVGDADLYLNAGSPAAESVWDCRPYIDGSSVETCTIASPEAGTWHVLVRGWSAYSDATVTASWG